LANLDAFFDILPQLRRLNQLGHGLISNLSLGLAERHADSSCPNGCRGSLFMSSIDFEAMRSSRICQVHDAKSPADFSLEILGAQDSSAADQGLAVRVFASFSLSGCTNLPSVPTHRCRKLLAQRRQQCPSNPFRSFGTFGQLTVPFFQVPLRPYVDFLPFFWVPCLAPIFRFLIFLRISFVQFVK
jgi:hypothetical protein